MQWSPPRLKVKGTVSTAGLYISTGSRMTPTQKWLPQKSHSKQQLVEVEYRVFLFYYVSDE